VADHESAPLAPVASRATRAGIPRYITGNDVVCNVKHADNTDAPNANTATTANRRNTPDNANIAGPLPS